MTLPPPPAVLYTNLSQLINLRRLPRQHALHHLHPPRHHIAPRSRIRDRLRHDLDDADAGIIGPAVMRAVAEVAQPRLQLRAVVLLDRGAVGDDARGAGEGGPFAAGVEEGDVDGGIVLEVVGFAGFGVGVEEEVDATALLGWGLVSVGHGGKVGGEGSREGGFHSP
jgi:hypothetical protein